MLARGDHGKEAACHVGWGLVKNLKSGVDGGKNTKGVPAWASTECCPGLLWSPVETLSKYVHGFSQELFYVR